MTSSKPREVAFEQAVNVRYMEWLRSKLSTPIEYSQSRSREWLCGHPNLGRDFSSVGPLEGRVGLDRPDDDLPLSFYIGHRYLSREGVTVYSWLAPISRLFFQPDCDDPAIEKVSVRRTFMHRGDAIIDLVDEQVGGPETTEAFAAPGLTVPTAPARPRRKAVTGGRLDPPSDIEEAPRAACLPASEDLEAGMRAVEAVKLRLLAPRTDRLSSVLSTLQPDQHELAVRNGDRPLVLQGHPGTGKTVVAAYRAAFMGDPEGGDCRRVLLLGPTRDYVGHVRTLIQQLCDPTIVHVSDIQSILEEVTGVKSSAGGPLDGSHDDVDAKARGLADVAVARLREAGQLKTGAGVRIANLRAVFEAVRVNGVQGKSLSTNPAWIDWMTALPPYEAAVALRRYLPLMAQCALAIQTRPRTDRYDHIIVDEAQDVSPIEWNVIEQLQRGDGWTLIGDMNQRRSDATYGSWREICDHLGLGDEDDPVEPVVMNRGYRSTGPILAFADRLLPKGERGARTLQLEGAPVEVEHVESANPVDLARSAVSKARRLCSSHPDGTVAIITVDPASALQALHSDGWRRPRGSQTTWRHDRESVSLHVPESARGLEFDAVVVVEPGAFPENLGRRAQLYTSLTRANRELGVVWHRNLPDAFRKLAR
jgi:DNA helicase IV